MTSFTDNFGGGDSITVAMLDDAKQARILETAEIVDGYNADDPPQFRLRFHHSDRYSGRTLYGNARIEIELKKLIASGDIPDRMEDWGGMKLLLFAAPVETRKGRVVAKQIAFKGWSEKHMAASEPTPTEPEFEPEPQPPSAEPDYIASDDSDIPF